MPVLKSPATGPVNGTRAGVASRLHTGTQEFRGRRPTSAGAIHAFSLSLSRRGH